MKTIVMKDIMMLLEHLGPDDLEAVRKYLHDVIDGHCHRCGRVLAVTQHLDHVDLPEGRVCMLCLGRS